MDDYSNYHKYHKITISYAEAEKYIKLGWTIKSINKVILRGINKEYEECTLVWELPYEPITPDDSN